MANSESNPAPLADAGLIAIQTDTFRYDFAVANFDSSDEGSVVSVPGPNGVLGTVRSSGGFSLTLSRPESRIASGGIDYELLRSQDVIFDLIYLSGYYQNNQFITVRAQRFNGCRVATVSRSLPTDGNLVENVTITAPSDEITRF